MKKSIIIVISLLLVIFFVVGIFVYIIKDKEEVVNIAISLPELEAKIHDIDEFDYSKMQDIDKDFATSNFLIDSRKIQDIIGKSPIISTTSSMYVVIKADNSNLQEIKMALESYGVEYETQWSTYLPDQYELVKNRQIGIKGNYVYMVISENPNTIIELIK